MRAHKGARMLAYEAAVQSRGGDALLDPEISDT
jgi:hypothetical protein